MLSAYLSKGVPLQETIHACQDIRKFVWVRGAKGGASVPRWRVSVARCYCRRGVHANARASHRVTPAARCAGTTRSTATIAIVDSKSLNKVAGSDGARPVMRLSATCPTDINRAHYVQIAEDMLRDIGGLDMKQLAHAKIIALLQTRAKLQEMCNGFATTDTIKIGDDIKHQIELPVAPLRQVFNDTIDSQAALLDAELADLGVVIS